MIGTGNGESNKPTINWVTRTLCTLGFVLGMAIAVLAYFEKAIPSELNSLAGIVIGGLLSMLTKSTPTASTPTEQQKPSGTVTVPEQQLDTTT